MYITFPQQNLFFWDKLTSAIFRSSGVKKEVVDVQSWTCWSPTLVTCWMTKISAQIEAFESSVRQAWKLVGESRIQTFRNGFLSGDQLQLSWQKLSRPGRAKCGENSRVVGWIIRHRSRQTAHHLVGLMFLAWLFHTSLEAKAAVVNVSGLANAGELNWFKVSTALGSAAKIPSWRRPLRRGAFEPYWKHTHCVSASPFILHRQENQILTPEYVNMQMKCRVSLQRKTFHTLSFESVSVSAPTPGSGLCDLGWTRCPLPELKELLWWKGGEGRRSETSGVHLCS